MQENILESFYAILDRVKDREVVAWMIAAKDEIIRLREYEWMYNDLNK